jgi:hypothetical protein
VHPVDEVKAVAAEAGATPAQVALAWLLAQGDDIAPIPGTKRVARVEENTATDKLELSAHQIERLNNPTPAAGERHKEETWPSSTADHARWSSSEDDRGRDGQAGRAEGPERFVALSRLLHSFAGERLAAAAGLVVERPCMRGVDSHASAGRV